MYAIAKTGYGGTITFTDMTILEQKSSAYLYDMDSRYWLMQSTATTTCTLTRTGGATGDYIEVIELD